MSIEDELLRELTELVTRSKAIAETLARREKLKLGRQPSFVEPGVYARAIVKHRDRLRNKLPRSLICDPAFDMLLELFAAREEVRNLSVNSVCLAAGCPPTTALRWIKLLELEGLIERVDDPSDGRRIFLRLSDSAHSLMIAWITGAPTMLQPSFDADRAGLLEA